MKDIRIMGGLGAILGLLSFIPYVGLVFGIASFVLILLAVQKLSNFYANKEIFNKYITGFIFSVVGFAFLFFFVISAFIVPFRNVISEFNNELNFSLFPNELRISSIDSRFLLMIFVFTILGFIMIVLGMFNWRKCFHLISQYTNIDYFRIAGNLYLWGAITTIILVGGLLILAAEVLLAVSFLSLPESA